MMLASDQLVTDACDVRFQVHERSFFLREPYW
jgi:hypothetical protein